MGLGQRRRPRRARAPPVPSRCPPGPYPAATRGCASRPQIAISLVLHAAGFVLLRDYSRRAIFGVGSPQNCCLLAARGSGELLIVALSGFQAQAFSQSPGMGTSSPRLDNHQQRPALAVHTQPAATTAQRSGFSRGPAQLRAGSTAPCDPLPTEAPAVVQQMPPGHVAGTKSPLNGGSEQSSS